MSGQTVWQIQKNKGCFTIDGLDSDEMVNDEKSETFWNGFNRLKKKEFHMETETFWWKMNI